MITPTFAGTTDRSESEARAWHRVRSRRPSRSSNAMLVLLVIAFRFVDPTRLVTRVGSR